MKKQFVSTLIALGFAAVCVTPAFGQDLDLLAGKWSIQKTNADGQRYTQQIEIKKNKFTFKITNTAGESQLYAEGDVKLDKAGPLKVIVFSNIKAGQTAAETDSIDDTYTSIYKLDGDSTLLMASNFDKDREGQKPSLDAYRKAAPAKK
jgi:uncharacterized protein (TIGR03067 family)